MNKAKFESSLLILFSLLSIFVLGFFDFCAKPQSDDWGWMEFINEYGMLGSYSNMRETFQTSPYMLFIMFPIVYLQNIIPYYFLLFVIQLTLPVTIFVYLNNYIKHRPTSWKQRFKQLLIITNICIFIFLTAWNTKTFQNAVFWLTGCLGYILPISLFIYLINLLLKPKKRRFENIIIYFLSFILVGVQINYVVIFGLFSIVLTWKGKIKLNKQLLFLSIWIVLSLIYTWSYPGWLHRIPAGNNLNLIEIGVSFIALFTKTITAEPVFFVSLIFYFIYLYNYFIFKTLNVTEYILPIFTLFLLSVVFQIIAFRGNIGYGRVHFLTHFLFLLIIVLLIIKYIKKIRVLNIWATLPLILSVVFFIYPLKFKLYQANRFSKAWMERDLELKNQLLKGQECIEVAKLPKSGILGYLDLSEEVDCSDFIGYKGNLEYPKIYQYDNWVYKTHYKFLGKIVIKNDDRGNK